MKRTISDLDARQQLADLLESVQDRGDEVVIERAGKPMAVVIPAERYEALERERERLWQFVEKAQAGNDDLAEEAVDALVRDAIREVRTELLDKSRQ